MIYTLDTNTISAILRRDSKVTAHIQNTILQNDITLNAVAYYETMRGLERPKYERKYQAFLGLLQDWRVLPLDIVSLDAAAVVYQYLRRNGIILEDADILLAGIAIAHDATLVTRNTKHFSRIPNLKLENWEA